MKDSIIIERLKSQGFNKRYIDEFMNIYKVSVIENIPNPLYYTFIRMKKIDN